MEAYAVVEHAGTDEEVVVKHFAQHIDACNYVESHYYDDERESLNVDIMKYDRYGRLTSEYWALNTIAIAEWVHTVNKGARSQT